MASKMLMNMIDEFLKGKYDVTDFSYDFPDKLIELNDKLENENKKLYNLLTDDMPDFCGNFEPNESARQGFEFLLDEEKLKEKTKTIYDKALKLI